MNAIQQISLKLRLGIDPTVRIRPGALRALWRAHAAECLNGTPPSRRSAPAPAFDAKPETRAR